MNDQLPAVLPSGAVAPAVSDDTYIRWCRRSIAALGDQAGWRYVEFFAANIRNPNTRRAYARACSRFFAWCEDRGLTLTTIRPFDVRRMDRAAAGEPRGAGREAAARRRADAVRLADHRPGRADEPGRRRARPEASS